MKPRFLYLDINRRCNLRCQHCFFWRREDAADGMTVPERGELIREFAELADPGARIVICGGEPMMAREAYWDACRVAREVGLRILSVVNGTRIHTAEVAERMCAEGPHEITISLDSHRPELHDEWRGVLGSHAVAVRALRLLLALRGYSKTPNIYAMAVLHEGMWRELGAFYEFVLRDVGADKLKLNVVQPSFGNVGPDPFFEAAPIRDIEGLRRELASCDAAYRVGMRPEWVEEVCQYMRDIAARGASGWLQRAGTAHQLCNSAERNIMCDSWGKIKLCFHPEFGSHQWSPGSLREWWEIGSHNARTRMAECRRFCGISHSVRKFSATLTKSNP